MRLYYNRTLVLWSYVFTCYSREQSLFCLFFILCSSSADGYTTDDMDLAWKQKEKPTDYKRDLQLPEFTIQNAITYNCTANFSTGMYR